MSQQLHIAKGPCPIPGCECHYPKKDGTICDYANVVRLEELNAKLVAVLRKCRSIGAPVAYDHALSAEVDAILRELGEA